MVILDEIKRRLSDLEPEVKDMADALAIERSKLRLEELEQKSAAPAFYNDTSKAKPAPCLSRKTQPPASA